MADWHARYLQLAALVASWSKDPSSQVGAVAVRDRRVLSLGYNGLPSGVVDAEERLNNREQKLLFTTHAEANVIATASRHGVSLEGADLYIWPFPPCSSCGSLIVQAGIQRVIVQDSEIPERWQASFDAAATMFSEAGVSLLRLPQLVQFNLSS